MIFGSNTYSCPKGKFLVNVKTAISEKSSFLEEKEGFSMKIKEFLLKEVKSQEKDWKLVFSGGYLQEKSEDLIKFKEESGVFLIKNNDFSMDLDNYFKEFTENIGRFLDEFQEKENGFFMTQNANEKEELEENEGKSEFNKLLEKLDHIVLNKPDNEEDKAKNQEIKLEKEGIKAENEENKVENEETKERIEQNEEKNEENTKESEGNQGKNEEKQ